MLNICIEPLLCASAAEDIAEKTGKKAPRLPGESQPEQEAAAYHMGMVTSASSKSRAGKGKWGAG